MSFLENKKILVCGGAGFMGSNFIHHVLGNSKSTVIYNLDILTYAGNLDNLAGLSKTRHVFCRGDINDFDKVKRLMKKVDFVINFAAETHVDRSIHSNADDFIKTNILGVHTLIKAIKECNNVRKMVHISTDEVWGDLDLKTNKKFNEDSPFKPNSPYAASKAAGDLLIRGYVKTYNLPIIVTHSVNNFGPRQFPEKLIPFFTLKLINNEKLPLYGDGLNVRDWIYVDDHSTAVTKILEKGVSGEVYGISANQERSNIEIASKILKVFDKDESILTFVKDRPGHDRRYSVNSSRLQSLGWRPHADFDSQLTKTVTWYLDNKLWLQSMQEKKTSINRHIK